MAWLAVLVALLLSGAMALAWRMALSTGQSGRIDAIWAFATGLAAAAAAAASQGDPLRRALVCVMAGAWSLRLGFETKAAEDHMASNRGRSDSTVFACEPAPAAWTSLSSLRLRFSV